LEHFVLGALKFTSLALGQKREPRTEREEAVGVAAVVAWLLLQVAWMPWIILQVAYSVI